MIKKKRPHLGGDGEEDNRKSWKERERKMI